MVFSCPLRRSMPVQDGSRYKLGQISLGQPASVEEVLRMLLSRPYGPSVIL